MHAVLQLDRAGTPQDWISVQDAATLICADHVAWSAGPRIATLHGGVSRASGVVSTLDIPAILATTGQARRDLASQVPPLSRHNVKLFARDRRLCAYCGDVFPAQMLTREHIHPQSRGGPDTWMNVVTACRSCNHRKADRTPEEAGMALLYAPYTPNWHEDFLLQRGGKSILADQMEFLMARVSQHSRLRIQ